MCRVKAMIELGESGVRRREQAGHFKAKPLSAQSARRFTVRRGVKAGRRLSPRGGTG